MDVSELKKGVAERGPWYHRIDLGSGVITPGTDDSPAKLRALALPDDLKGMRVLDIGAEDGFFSFEAERRGAERVVAVDSYYSAGSRGAEVRARFDFASKVLKSRVEHVDLDVFDLSVEKIGSFDLVLFLGVLYHLRHPLLALERVFDVTQGQLVLETHTDETWNRRPLMVFYPGKEVNCDSTNWWGPNPAAVEAMLQTAGFPRVKKIGLTFSRARRIGMAVKSRIGGTAYLGFNAQMNRVVFHAWR